MSNIFKFLLYLLMTSQALRCGILSANEEKIIGIIGGMGPLAGVALHEMIISETSDVEKDQDHLSVCHYSFSNKMEDRSKYLLDPKKYQNPGHAATKIAKDLHRNGAKLIAIPCNTMHAPEILEPVEEFVKSQKDLEFVNMIDEVGRYIHKKFPKVRRVGLLATTGTCESKVYEHYLEKYELEILKPTDSTQEDYVQKAVYDPKVGLKASSHNVQPQVYQWLDQAINELKEQDIQIIILGCTEFPLAIKGENYHGFPIINSTKVLAKAIVKRAK